MGLFQKIKEGLTKTRNSMTSVFGNLFASLRPVDEDMMEGLTDALIMADVGVELTEEIIDQLRDRIKEKHLKDSGEVKTELCDILTGILKAGEGDFKLTTKPSVILMVGVNGVGKTTSIGKMAAKFKADGKKVIICAGDTFRAAAADQLPTSDPVSNHTADQLPASDPVSSHTADRAFALSIARKAAASKARYPLDYTMTRAIKQYRVI